MKETSFGKMKVILEDNGNPKIEHLVFEKEGRPHRHTEYESFFVISGEGVVVNGKNKISVKPGDLTTIPPKTNHWMIPGGSEPLVGFIWYHEAEINRKNH